MTDMIKRMMAVLLSISMIAALFPAAGIIRADAKEAVELLDVGAGGEYTYVNRYETVYNDYVGNANFETIPVYKDLAERAHDVNSSQWSYIAFAVDAPEDGAYAVNAQYQLSITCSDWEAREKYASFVVNEGGKGNVYKAVWKGENGASATTENAMVNLKKGRNLIYCFAFTQEMIDDSSGYWANFQWFHVDGRLTVVKEDFESVNTDSLAAENINMMNKNSGYLGGANNSYRKEISLSSLSQANIGNVPYFAYTVTAPEDGYYLMGVNFSGNNAADESAVAVCVLDPDGGWSQYQKSFHYHNGKNSGVLDLSAYLKKGENTVVVTEQLPKEAGGQAGWTDFSWISLRGGLTMASAQANPFTRLNGKNDYNKISYKEGEMTGGINWWIVDFQDKAQLEDYLDASNNYYVTYYVEAPQDGTYGVRFKTGRGGGDNVNDTSQVSAVLVNDSQIYLLDNVKGLVTETAAVSLKKGINVIRCMPWVKAGSIQSSYMDYYYAELDARLTALETDEVTLKPAEAPGVYNYTKNSDGALGSANATVAKAMKVSAESLTYQNISTVPHMGYLVEAPQDGYYDIDLLFSGDGSCQQNAFVLMVLDEKGGLEKIETKKYEYRVDGSISWSSRKHRVDLSTELTKGTHYLMVTMQLPRTDETAQSYSSGWWTDLCELRLRGGLVPAAEQKDLYQERFSDYKTLEVTEYAVVNGYGTISENYLGNCWYSGGMGPDAAVSEAELSGDKGFDKLNVPYVEYAVTAPADGSYRIWTDYIGEYYSEYYMTVQVNGKTLYRTTKYEPLSVELTEGNNIIRLIPYTRELLYTLREAGQNKGYINMQSLKVEQQLIGIPNTKEVLLAADASYINNLQKGTHPNAGTRLDSSKTGGYVREMTLDSISRYTLERLSHFSYTVEAPENGYYDINVRLNVDWAYRSGYYMGLVVDGDQVSYARIEDTDMMKDEATTVSGVADCTVYLTSGTHVLTFVQHLPKTSLQQQSYKETGWAFAWTNFYSVELYGGLKKAEKQEDILPKTDMHVIEAEDDSYTIWNLFGVNNDTDNLKQKNGSASGGYVLGAGDYNYLQTEDSMKEFLSKTDTAYVGILLDAPQDGEYTIRLSYQLWISESEKYWQKYGMPYAVVKVNDTGFYQAPFGGNNGDISTAELKVTLKKGRNVVYAMFSKELLSNIRSINEKGYFWANFDCLAVDKALTPVPKNMVKLEAEDSPYINSFYMVNEAPKASNGKTLAGANLNDIRLKQYSIEELNSDNISSVPYFSYTVEAPADGYYDLSLSFATEGRQRTFGVVVDGTASYAAVYDNGNHGLDRFDRHSADVSLWLTKGTHVLTFTSEMPAKKDDAKDYGWTDFDALTMYGGLTLASQQQNPEDAVTLTYLEAETYAYADKYMGIQEGKNYSGGKAVGNANAWGQESEAMMKALDVGEMCYVEYIVDADETATYTVKLGVEYGANMNYPEGFTPFVIMYVNGTPQKILIHDAKGTVSRIPVEVSLTAGRNVIRVSGVPRDIQEQFDFKIWVNHDYLAVPAGLTGVVNEGYRKAEAEEAQYIGNFNIADQKGASGDKVLGGSSLSGAMAGVTTENLSRDNFEAASYVSYTVNAPKSGYYTIGANVQLPGGTSFGKVGLLADDKPYPMYLWQNQWAGKNYCETTVYLTAGNHVLVFTGLLADSFEDMTEYDWMDYDFVRFGQGITLAQSQKKPVTATAYTRLEAEEYAMCNQYKRNTEDGYLSGKAGNTLRNVPDAQSFEELKEDGLNAVKTPYIQYRIIAPENGTYKVRLGTTYQHSGESEQKYSSFAVIVNGEASEHRVNYYNNVYCRPFVLEMKLTLKKGENDVIFTGFLKDTTSEESKACNNYDFLDVSGGLSAIAVGGRVEAENSEYNGYIPSSELSSSGKMALMTEDWNSVYTNDMTFANLTAKNADNAPWVKYTVTAEKAGTYQIGIGYNSGGSEVTPVEVYTAVIVNDGTPMKVPMRRTWNCSTVCEVELEKGENTILVSGALKDFLNYPEYPSQSGGSGMWIDQDYLDLGPGLKGIDSEADGARTSQGDDAANINVALSSVWGDFTGSKSPQDTIIEEIDGKAKWPLILAAVLGCAVIAGGMILLVAVKKKKEEEQHE